jgi:S1-C subfamily serine protease
MNRKAFLLFTYTLFFFILFSFSSFSKSTKQIGDILKAATVYIEIRDGDDEELMWTGTGTVINKKGDKYYILTNGHVVNKEWNFIDEPVPFEEGEVYIIVFPHKSLISDSADVHPGYLISNYFYWIEMDLALLVVDYDADSNIFNIDDPKKEDYVEFIPLKIGSSLDMIELDSVYAAGYPIVLGNEKETYTPSIFITKGEINSFIDDEEGWESAVNYSIVFRAGLQGGMSGGPLVNSKGELIGINGLTEGAYAIESNIISEKIIPQKSIYDYAIMIEDFILTALLDDEFNNNPESIFYGYMPKIRNSQKKELLEDWDNNQYFLPGKGYKSDFEELNSN